MTNEAPAPSLKSLNDADVACPMCGSTRHLGIQNRGGSPVTCDSCGGEFDLELQPALVQTT